MTRNRLAQSLLGLVVGAVMVSALSLPAAADTEPAGITGGSLELYEVFGTTPFLELGLTGQFGCIFAPTTVTMTGTGSSGTWEASVGFDSAMTIGLATYRVIMSVEMSGTYSSTLLSGTGTMAISMRRTVGGEFPCSYDTDFGTCTIEATNLALGGTHTVSPPPDIQSGDVFDLMGGNTSFETTVTGAAGDCGALAALDNGFIGVDHLELTVP